ncbi:Uncharacterized conserved protein YndB, AHSA1/START domain [Streptomyces sp. WMMB 714]|uniref:SRPBCC family protein n=1 Tax=Streptomyces sp. WMMB 714 TaxID=1286822 RepID=UPI0005F77A63|nr:SRPBCC domain-containing protein [Streptomyces sp. WMMB 714]SCK05588.1 Uncharacterized conserved protein YndB, AHSA1/START domain [Streptomyces sp. WMMB 714]
MTRPTGLTKDAGYEIGVSRTLPVPPEAVWDYLTGPEGQAAWLGEGPAVELRRGARYTLADGTAGEVRGCRPGVRLRLTHRPPEGGESTVQFTIQARGSRSVLQFHQERLADARERERQRHHWRAVMERVTDALTPAA